jgi:dTDP-4-amino-4,6-dideoxygalactose transaminase
MHDETELAALKRVLERPRWGYGEEVSAFENEFAAFQGAPYCVSCTSGTTALEVSLRALGVRPGDEVIVPAYTFIATASAALAVGAVPSFVDVDESWCMDPAAAEAAITERSKVIIPVHFSGCMADMDRLLPLAESHGLKVLEDACHAWGTQWDGRGAGTLGHCGVFSFQASKNMTAGEGGAIVTTDEELARQAGAITNTGRVEGESYNVHTRPGTNARMSEFGAALLRAQLTRMEEQTRIREENAGRLTEALREIEGLTPQAGTGRETRRSYHLYCLRIDPESFGCTRAQFCAAAQAEGLPTGAGYTLPLYEQPMFTEYGAPCVKRPCPVVEDLCAHSGMFLGHQFLLGSAADIDDIVAICEKVKRQAGSIPAQ